MKPPKYWWSQTWKSVAAWHPQNRKAEKMWKAEVTQTVTKIWNDLPVVVKQSLQQGVRSVKAELPCPACKSMNPVSKTNVILKCRKCGKKLFSVRVKGI